MKACCAAVLFAITFCTLACVPRRAVVPQRYPAAVSEPAAFQELGLYLRKFNVHGLASKDSPSAVDALRQSFLRCLARTSQFRAIVDLAAYPQPLASPAVILDVELDVDHSAYRTWILDAPGIFPMPGYWPLTPSWGWAEVRVLATLVDEAGEALWRSERAAEDGYFVLFYSWYRTREVEEAYREAYAKVFTEIATDLAGAREPIVTAVRASSPPASPSPRKPAPASTRVAVMPAQIDSSTAGAVPDIFDDYLLTATQNAGPFQVIGQSDIAAMLDFERQKDLLACDDASCMAELGGALGVDLMVAVQVARVEAEWVVNAKLINIREGRVEARVNRFLSGQVKQLLEGVPGLIAELMGR